MELKQWPTVLNIEVNFSEKKITVVKVRGLGGLSPLLPFEPHAIVNPLIESIKCYFMPK